MRLFAKDRAGAAAVEYGLVAAFLATMIVLAFPILGSALLTSLQNIVGLFPTIK